MPVSIVPKMQHRSHNLVFQPDHLAMHIKISHKKESNASDLYKCLTNNSLRESGKTLCIKHHQYMLPYSKNIFMYFGHLHFTVCHEIFSFLGFREEADSWWSHRCKNIFPFKCLWLLPCTGTEISWEREQSLSELCQTVAKGCVFLEALLYRGTALDMCQR